MTYSDDDQHEDPRKDRAMSSKFNDEFEAMVAEKSAACVEFGKAALAIRDEISAKFVALGRALADGLSHDAD